MTLTFVNSSFNRQESLYTDFLAFCRARGVDVCRALATDNEQTMLRYVLSLASHVRAPVRLLVTDGTSPWQPALEQVTAFLEGEQATPGTDDEVDIIFVAPAFGGELPEPRLRPGGWLILPPGADSPAGLERQTDVFGWTVWRCPATAEDFSGRVHIIVPTFNRCAMLRDCLRHVEAQTVAGKINCIVVDDGSSDGTADMMQADYPHMTVLTGDGSLWWGGGINMGLAHVREIMEPEDFFLFLNNDVVLDTVTVERLLTLAVKDRATCWATAAIAGTQAVASGERGHALYRFEWMLDLLSQQGGEVEVSYLFGRTTLMPVELLDAIGDIDTASFQHYWADSDYSLRAKAHGYATAITGTCFIRVAHGPETTGSHIDFFDTGRSLRDIWRYFTDIKSLGNLSYAWRFYSRHDRDNRLSLTWRVIARALGNHRWLRRSDDR